MELNVLEQEKKRIVFELPGADHTLCNALKQELWNDDDITVSAYNISHPLIGIPKFVVEGKDVKKSLKEASSRLQKQNSSFLKAFKNLS